MQSITKEKDSIIIEIVDQLLELDESDLNEAKITTIIERNGSTNDEFTEKTTKVAFELHRQKKMIQAFYCFKIVFDSIDVDNIDVECSIFQARSINGLLGTALHFYKSENKENKIKKLKEVVAITEDASKFIFSKENEVKKQLIPLYHASMGLVSSEISDHVKALKHFKYALRGDLNASNKEKTIFKLSNIYKLQGDINQAIKQIQELENSITVENQKSEKSAKIYSKLAELYKEKASNKEALEYLDKANCCDCRPKTKIAVNQMIGEIYLSEGNTKDAQTAYEAAYNNCLSNPHDKDSALSNLTCKLTDIYLKNGENVRAKEILAKALENPDFINPDTPMLFYKKFELGSLFYSETLSVEITKECLDSISKATAEIIKNSNLSDEHLIVSCQQVFERMKDYISRILSYKDQETQKSYVKTVFDLYQIWQPEILDFPHSLYFLLDNYIHLGNRKKQNSEMYMEGLNVYEDIFGKGHYRTINVFDLLVKSTKIRGDYVAEEHHLNQKLDAILNAILSNSPSGSDEYNLLQKQVKLLEKSLKDNSKSLEDIANYIYRLYYSFSDNIYLLILEIFESLKKHDTKKAKSFFGILDEYLIKENNKFDFPAILISRFAYERFLLASPNAIKSRNDFIYKSKKTSDLIKSKFQGINDIVNSDYGHPDHEESWKIFFEWLDSVSNQPNNLPKKGREKNIVDDEPPWVNNSWFKRYLPMVSFLAGIASIIGVFISILFYFF